MMDRWWDRGGVVVDGSCLCWIMLVGANAIATYRSR